MIFVCGIHGVGKTEYCRELAKKKGIPTFSASQLIGEVEKNAYDGKRVSDVKRNQNVLIKQIKKLKEEVGDFILDGHMCLINQKGNIEAIREEVFKSLDVECIEVLIDSPRNICERLRKRDGKVWEENLVEKFQNHELQHAKKISKALDVDLKIIKVPNKKREEKSCFGKNIILPIKPVFVEKILKGEKMFEYRKQVCTENIDKIYLYATAPVQTILGEAEVSEKIIMHKESLWDISKDQSGITKEYYDEYFCKSRMASAYRLGETRCYKEPIKLDEVGFTFVPQSSVYVKEEVIMRIIAIDSEYNG